MNEELFFVFGPNKSYPGLKFNKKNYSNKKTKRFLKTNISFVQPIDYEKIENHIIVYYEMTNKISYVERFLKEIKKVIKEKKDQNNYERTLFLNPTKAFYGLDNLTVFSCYDFCVVYPMFFEFRVSSQSQFEEMEMVLDEICKVTKGVNSMFSKGKRIESELVGQQYQLHPQIGGYSQLGGYPQWGSYSYTNSYYQQKQAKPEKAKSKQLKNNSVNKIAKQKLREIVMQCVFEPYTKEDELKDMWFAATFSIDVLNFAGSLGTNNLSWIGIFSKIGEIFKRQINYTVHKLKEEKFAELLKIPVVKAMRIILGISNSILKNETLIKTFKKENIEECLNTIQTINIHNEMIKSGEMMNVFVEELSKLGRKKRGKKKRKNVI